MNSAISYARGGIELQLLPDCKFSQNLSNEKVLTKTLGLSIPIDSMKNLLEALEILFTVEKEEEEKKDEPDPMESFPAKGNPRYS